ncbi:MAG TPA: hypothetical protein VHX67_04520 [Acidimicrobiales bacterium]|jgi:hypothetical protein|nr:hypothetical protein [Acidimicrobiales bacterium]
MIATHVLSLVLGILVGLAVLGSALKTVVLPRQGFPRLSQFVFALVHRLLVHPRRNDRLALSLRGLYAPVALVSLPLAWMILMMLAFTGIYWGSRDLTWARSFEISVSSVTTMGFAEPNGTGRIWIAFVEATIGLGLVALLISYLPTIYSAYNDREKGTNRLRPIAGSPPNAPEFLQSLQRLGSLESPDLWRNSADWMLDLEQTHTAFPILSYFPESNSEQSWVATVGTLLDASALVFAVSDLDVGEVFADVQKGPLTVLVYGLPLIVRIARAVNIPLPPPTRLPDLMAHSGQTAPAISISRAEYDTAMAAVSEILVVEPGQEERVWRQFAWIRSAYDPALRALAGVTLAAPAAWTTDRPAMVGRPRFLRHRAVRVDWSQGPPLPVTSATSIGG